MNNSQTDYVGWYITNKDFEWTLLTLYFMHIKILIFLEFLNDFYHMMRPRIKNIIFF